MPNFKSISFKMAVLQGGGQNLPFPSVCYPKDPMWNRVNPIRPGGLRGPDGQTPSCQSETSYPIMPKLGDF